MQTGVFGFTSRKVIQELISCSDGDAVLLRARRLIGFLRRHLVDVLAQLVHAPNFTQKAISHRRRPFSRLRLRCRDLSCLLYYRRARGFSRSSATRGVPRRHRSPRSPTISSAISQTTVSQKFRSSIISSEG